MTSLSNYQQVRDQERQRKLAYRQELDAQIMMHRLQRQKQMERSFRERAEIQKEAQTQREKRFEVRHNKIKTQQKYMKDNFQMMPNSPIKKNPPIAFSSEHPFIHLVDEMQERNQRTKQHFIYQNHLNAIQSQIRQQARERKKKNQHLQKEKLLSHEQQQFQRRQQERQMFQKKYLKVKVKKGEDNKSQYLQYLKEQAEEHRKVNAKNHPQFSNSYNLRTPPTDSLQTYSSPAYLGQIPQSYDRRMQLQRLDRSLNFNLIKQTNQTQPLISNPQNPRTNKDTFETTRQYEISIPSSRRNYEKVLTENKSEPRSRGEDRSMSAINGDNGTSSRLRKQYKQYDFILGKQRTIFL